MKSSRTLFGFLVILALLLVIDSSAFAQRGAHGSAGRSSPGTSRSRASSPSRAPQRSRASAPSRAPQRSRASAPSRSAPSRTASPSSSGRRSYSPPTRGASRTATPTRASRATTTPSRTNSARSSRNSRSYDSGRSSNSRGSSYTPRSTTPNTSPSTGRATLNAPGRDRVYDSGRSSRATTTGSSFRTPENTGRARFDRYKNRDVSSGRTRFVRVDSDRPSSIVDLTGASAPRRTRSAIPRLRGSSPTAAKRLGSARFEPRTTPRTEAAARVRASRVRTSPITRGSVLKRYTKPNRSTASVVKEPRKNQASRGQRRSGEAKNRTKTRTAGNSTKTATTPLTAKQQRAKSKRTFDALVKKDAKLAGKVDKAALDSARLTDVSLKVGINVGLAIGGAGVGLAFYDNDFASPNPYYGPSDGNHNFWNSYAQWSVGHPYYSYFPYSGLYHYYGYPYWNGYRSRYYGGYPYYYSSLYAGYYSGYDDDQYEDGFEEGYDRGFDSGLATGGEVVQEGEALVQVEGGRGQLASGTRLVPSSSDVNKEALTRTAAYYLSVGDGAFLEKRYGDAVSFYAKAIEFAPDEGVLYLILSDALFATGDYHYAAYALRKALELDPALMEAIDDKHSFYKDPADFDQQVAVLELFLEDHYVDDDARLLLASNYLFGNRPAAAVDLLENSFSKSVRESQTGQLILAAAISIQYGTPKTD